MKTHNFPDLIRIFGRIGLLSFGGPAAQIALMHRELVEERPWLTEDQFLRALSFCMLLPGPEAMQLATYAGWQMRGVRGGLIAGLLFVLPGAAVVLTLAMAYAYLGNVPLVQALFLGIKATVVIVVIEALLKVSKKALHGTDRWVIAGLSFLAIFALGLPFPLIIGLAALYGAITTKGTADLVPPQATPNTLSTTAIWAALWAAPLLVLWIIDSTMLAQIGVFFSKLAVVTFGGAYAVLAYMTQTVVGEFGWLSTPEMMDGLGLAETTPGPLILVTEFVGFLAAFKAQGLGMALIAAALTLWVTFIPCFLWIFACAPYIERLTAQHRLSAALNCVTAAVVGVILNLSIWFALHVFFTDITPVQLGWADIPLPHLPSVNILAVCLAAIAGVLLLLRHWKLPLVLVMMAAASGILHSL